MNPKDPRFDAVLNADDPDFEEKFREAIGAEEGDTIEITKPQFTRTPDQPPPPSLPETDDDWKQLYSMTVEEARERGFGSWDGGLMLFPGEWFPHIPAWLEVEDIMGEKSVWGAEPRDDDTRFGCLAYGVRIGPPTDGED